MSKSELSGLQLELWQEFRHLGERLPTLISQTVYSTTRLSAAELRVLMEITHLKSKNRAVYQRDLLKRLDWEKSRLSHLLNRMHSKRLILRDQSHSTSPTIELREKGQAAMQIAVPLRNQYLTQHFFKELTQVEQETMLTLLRKVAKNIE